MPKVPMYDQQAQTRPLPVPRVSAPGSTGMEAVGRGLQQLGAGVDAVTRQAAAIYREERQRDDEARVMDAYSKLGAWQKRSLYDPKTGALALEGEHALGLSEKVLQEFDAEATAIEGALAGETQKQAFRKVRDREREQVFTQLSGHERRQSDAVRKQKTQAALETSISNAANRWSVPGGPGEAQLLGEAAIRSRAAAEGWPGEATARELAEYRTKLHLTVLDRMTDAGQVEAAEQYLADFGAEIDGTVRAQSNVDKVVTGLKAKQAGAAEFGRIYGAAPDDEEKQADLLLAIEDPAVREEAAKHLENTRKVKRGAREAADKERLGRLFVGIDDGKGLDRNSKDFNLLSDEGKAKAVAHARTFERSRRSESREDRRLQQEADALAIEQFKARETPDQVKADLATDYPEASPKARAKLQGLQKTAREDLDEKNAPALDEFKGLVQDRAIAAKYTKTTAREFAARMLGVRSDWIRANGGKRPSREEAVQLIEEQQKKMVLEGLLFDTKKPRWQLTPEERERAKPVEGETVPASGSAPATGVRMQAPDGKVYRVPENQVEESAKRGWKRL